MSDTASAPQRVLVTGGAAGIGLAITRAFIAAGARVHIADPDAGAVASVTACAPAITGTVCDIADTAAVAAMIEDLIRALGGLDVLVNNAGIAGPTAPVDEYAREAWDAVVAVNLSGTFDVTRRAIPLLKQSPAASIIVMSSLAGRFGYPDRVAYATTKWGLVGFTKTLALELGPYGMTANSIHPGGVEGARVREVLRRRADVSGRSVDEENERALDNQSIRRFTEAADIAALAVFLAGPHARTISGQMLPIDGDSKAARWGAHGCQWRPGRCEPCPWERPDPRLPCTASALPPPRRTGSAMACACPWPSICSAVASPG
jgi:NAD(P)-dependent dehydrogenase (short-subunit alcohol dehydrogenase family)